MNRTSKLITTVIKLCSLFAFVLASLYFFIQHRIHSAETEIFQSELQIQAERHMLASPETVDRPEDLGTFKEKYLRYTKPFLLKEITKFEWDKVCISVADDGDYSPPPTQIHKLISKNGFEYGSFTQRIPYPLSYLPAPFSFNQYESVFIFVKDNRVAHLIKNVDKHLSIKNRRYILWPTLERGCSKTNNVQIEVADYLPRKIISTIGPRVTTKQSVINFFEE